MSLVEKIRTLCKQHNTTVKAIERELGIANGSIKNWDISKPSYDKTIAVAEKLNVSLEWLLTGKDSEGLSQNESKLVDLYRKTNDTGQPLTMKHAEDIQKALPRQELSQEQTLSNSKIG